MKKKLNKRCPLQTECERKCEYEGHELDCDYYENNAVGEDRTIPDQEEIRDRRERERLDADLEEELAAGEDEEEAVAADHIADADKMVYIPIDCLHPHPDNPRKELGDLTELADSIKANGVFQNLTVVPYFSPVHQREMDGLYTIIIGHRRHAAAKLAGLDTLPCVITTMTKAEQVQTMLMENIQRSDLTVYEQAQGFQMMLDLGSTVDEIAEKSGFSKKTVRRRLEIAKLDDKTLKKVSERQLTFSDFDELAKVDDMDTRNKVLKSMGTPNFQNEIKSALEAQAFQKRIAEWLAVIRTFATEDEKASYSSHQYVRGYNKWNLSAEAEVPEDAATTKYVYKLDTNGISLYKERDTTKEDAEKAARAEKERIEKAERAERDELNRRHHELRCDFVKSLSNTTCKKQFKEVMEFATLVMWDMSVGGYNSAEIDPDILSLVLGVKVDTDALEDGETLIDIPGIRSALEAFPEKTLLALAYSAVDAPREGYWHHNWENGKYEYRFRENEALNTVYGLLSAFGYELSDEEEQAKSGKHPLFPAEREEDPCAVCKSAHPTCDECCSACKDHCNAWQGCRRESEDDA